MISITIHLGLELLSLHSKLKDKREIKLATRQIHRDRKWNSGCQGIQRGGDGELLLISIEPRFGR